MKNNYHDLDDYTDHSPSLALTEYIMCPVITVVVTGLVVAACTYFKLLLKEDKPWNGYTTAGCST